MIKKEYKLSDSTYRRILARTLSQTKCPDKSVEDFIKNFIEPPTTPMTVNLIRSQVEKGLGVRIGRGATISILKNRLNYSFKKGCYRPLKYKSPANNIQKSLFGLHLLNLLLSKQVIWNVDEASFDRGLSRDYSWLPKKEGQPIIGSVVSGKSTLILATSSDGEWFGFITNKTTSSFEFCVFLRLISKVIKQLGIS